MEKPYKLLFMVLLLCLCSTYALKVRSLSAQPNKENGSKSNNSLIVNSQSTKTDPDVYQISKKSLAVLCVAIVSAGLFVYFLLKCVEMSNMSRLELKKKQRIVKVEKANIINEHLIDVGLVESNELF